MSSSNPDLSVYCIVLLLKLSSIELIDLLPRVPSGGPCGFIVPFREDIED
jgi:hypothetical protein